MSIPNSYYVDITALAGGSPTVETRQPIGRWFTTNALCPMGTVKEFESADDVKSWFGENSQEYQRAESYFGFLSKKLRSPKRISFARYTPTGTAVGASIISGNNTFNVDAFKEIISGNLVVSYIDPINGTVSGETDTIDLSASQSLADVASNLQSSIRAITVSEETPFSTATVTYITSMNGSRFVLELPSGYGSFNICTGTLADMLGWGYNAILSDGNNGVDSIDESVASVMNENDNCYTFAFIETLDIDDIIAVATWNENQNAMFMYVVPFNSISSASTNVLNLDFDHCWVQFDNSGEYQEFMPMAALACVDYTKDNASINFMFQSFPNNTTVVKDLNTARSLDLLKINYYAEVQSAGIKSGWLQRGKCQGQFADATVAVNAIWLKAEVIRKVKELFALNDSIPANKDGQSKIKACLNDIWAQGIRNGCILKDKPLSESEKSFILSITNDENAWIQVQQNGIWFDCSIEVSDSQYSLGEKFFSFTLIYGAADQIRKVEGRQIAVTTAR